MSLFEKNKAKAKPENKTIMSRITNTGEAALYKQMHDHTETYTRRISMIDTGVNEYLYSHVNQKLLAIKNFHKGAEHKASYQFHFEKVPERPIDKDERTVNERYRIKVKTPIDMENQQNKLEKELEEMRETIKQLSNK